MDIVILGGGTAGWLAALTIAKTQPNHNVTVIESKKIGIVGAGEGSTGIFVDFLQNKFFDTGINYQEFCEFTNATQKIGIKHINWKGDGTHYFAPLDGSITSFNSPDVQFCQALMNIPDKPYLITQLGNGYENGFVANGHALHFDAFKVGEYFSKIAIEAGVKHIDAEIVGAATNPSATDVVCLVDTNGNNHYGDFFIDCSGFGRTICGAIGNEWHSYTDDLPVNSAIAFQKPLDDEMEPLTSAIAMDAGWVWKIPTTERYGMGYVYSDKYISDFEAEVEVNAKFDSPEILRRFKFTSGRSEVLWKHNCLALGLSAAFAEPLEATSIHTTVVQILNFVMEHLQETKERTCNEYRINQYNQEMIEMYDRIRDFLVVHYTAGRDDTEFWKYMNSGQNFNDNIRYIMDVCKDSIPSSTTIPSHNSSPASSLWNWVLNGTGKIGKEQAENVLKRFSIV